jgi:alpha-L-fucosidase
MPHSLTVDLGPSLRIGGLCYVPVPPRGRGRGDNGGGVIETYRFETSEDGKSWTTNVNEGRFGNIRNNPIAQEVPFAPVTARYFRFTALREVNGGNIASVAEITVLPANP